jgi:tetratricopeptide (TPR) repeat protein
MKRKLLKPDHPEIAPSLNNLAAVLACQGKFDAADPLYREALALYRKLHGDQHRNVATALANLGANLRLQGRLDQAETCLREALDMRRKLLGEDHPDVALSLYELARLLAQNNLLGEAEKLHRDALALRRKQAGNNPAKLAVSLDGLARVLLLAGRPAEAEPLARECLATRETGKPGDWRLASARCLLGQCLLARHDYAAAEKLLLSGYDTMLLQKAQIPAESRDLLNQAARCLVRLYETTNRDDLAARWRKNLADLDPAPTPPPATLPKP